MLVERLHDGAAHGGDLMVEFEYDGAVGRGVGQQALTRQHALVVCLDLCCERGRRTAERYRCGRDQAVLRRVAEDEVADVSGDFETAFERERLLLELAQLVGAHRSLVLGAVNLVVLLERRHIVVGLVQLTAENRETVVDELLGNVRYGALVVDRIDVVGLDDAVDDILGTLGHHVGHRDVDDRSLLVGDFASELAAIRFDSLVERQLRYVDILADEFGDVWRLAQDDRAQRRGYRIAKRGRHAEVLVIGKVRQLDAVLVYDVDLEANGIVVCRIDELDQNRRASVEIGCLYASLLLVYRRQVELADDLLHKAARLEYVELVVDAVTQHAAAHQIAERSHFAARTLARVLHENRCRPLVYGRGAADVECGAEPAYQYRQCEPVPVRKYELNEILEGEFTYFQRLLLVMYVILFHCFGCAVILLW